MNSYALLETALAGIQTESTEIELEETKEIIRLPSHALKVLSVVLKAMAAGNPISIVPVQAELTTQAAADLLGCSRPHLVKLLEQGLIPYTKVGKHRRVRMEDVVQYRRAMKAQQRQALMDLMSHDEESGLYDS